MLRNHGTCRCDTRSSLRLFCCHGNSSNCEQYACEKRLRGKEEGNEGGRKGGKEGGRVGGRDGEDRREEWR